MYSKELFIIGVCKNMNAGISTAITFNPKLKFYFLSFANKYLNNTININNKIVLNRHKTLII